MLQSVNTEAANEDNVLTDAEEDTERDEFEIPELVLMKKPGNEELERRKKISSLRKKYGERFDSIGEFY